jgi:N-glycosylase/DNA lyase
MELPSAHGVEALRFLWEQHSKDFRIATTPRDRWIDEFFFCMLGGFGISYELNKSAYEVLKAKGLFEPSLYELESTPLQLLLEAELSTSQFKPLKKNGSLRKYRFFRSKANTIAEAGRWLFQSCRFSIEALLTSNSHYNRDQFLKCPGIGYKTASWFLRNIGVGQDLAILDTHVVRVLIELEIISKDFSLPRDYLEIEYIFLNVCNSINAPIEIMDLIIWNWDRKITRFGYES